MRLIAVCIALLFSLNAQASPYGTGWTKNEQLLTYFQEARGAGITGHAMTLAAASHNGKDDGLTDWGRAVTDEMVKLRKDMLERYQTR
ncbi:MAG: hypothetical protein V7709_14620 [Halioglobus sp.]